MRVVWDKVLEVVKKDTSRHAKKVLEELALPLEIADFRATMTPVYNALTLAVEFREENEHLSERYEAMSGKLEKVFTHAKKILTSEEYEELKIASEQVRNFAAFKDVMGEIDTHLIPFWFGLLEKVEDMLSKEKEVIKKPMGHAGMFYHLVWYLPPDLKAKVMTPDTTPFDLKTL